MTLIEAIKSGRPFRRKGHAWFVGMPDLFKIGDVLADDWETQEQTVTITRTQFLEAFGQLYCEPQYSNRQVDSQFGIDLARKLGLEDKP